MLIKQKKRWEISENEATDEAVYLNRRQWLKAAGFSGLGLMASGLATGLATGLAGGLLNPAHAAPITGFPAARNKAYALDRDITPETDATTYTNFYEFGSSKNIWRKAQALEEIIDPWVVTIDGMVETELKLDAADLVKQMGPMEERLYRHRCVEAWAMAVPWTGVPMSRLVDIAKPTGGAKYIRMETFMDRSIAPGQGQSWYPWPYVEGMTIEEAQNELAFLATGLYGKSMPMQNGAPIRLVLPWKYGFKGIKSIVRFTFTNERPVSFWEQLAANEYGFWANVNPDVAHPRWSQATERLLGTNRRVETKLYNGYGPEVAGLYANIPVASDRELFY